MTFTNYSEEQITAYLENLSWGKEYEPVSPYLIIVIAPLEEEVLKSK